METTTPLVTIAAPIDTLRPWQIQLVQTCQGETPKVVYVMPKDAPVGTSDNNFKVWMMFAPELAGRWKISSTLSTNFLELDSLKSAAARQNPDDKGICVLEGFNPNNARITLTPQDLDRWSKANDCHVVVMV